MKRITLYLTAIACLFVALVAFADKTTVLYYGHGKPPGKYKVYIHETYEYYVYPGDMLDLDKIGIIVDAVDNAFAAWGNPVIPRFMGISDCASRYNDGINTIGINIIADSDGSVALNTKGVAIYDVESEVFIDEADIALSSFSGWEELGYHVSIDGVPEYNCNLRSVMAHEVGHILGYTFHSNRPGTLMYYTGACAGETERPTSRELAKMQRAYRWRDKMFKRNKVTIALDRSE